MTTIRRYGDSPYNTVVIHGGPGAAGEMAPVAVELAKSQGVLEPLFTGRSIAAQIAELNGALAQCDGPVTLIGHSWGAWLALLYASGNAQSCAQVVLVGCPPPNEKDAAGINEARLLRLSAADRDKVVDITAFLDAPDGDKDSLFSRLGQLINRADTYDPVDDPAPLVDYSYETFAAVWPEAVALRRSGRLRSAFNDLKPPVLAIQGDYDPHPASAIDAAVAPLPNARFVRLDRCGHTPWREKQARTGFFNLIDP